MDSIIWVVIAVIVGGMLGFGWIIAKAVLNKQMFAKPDPDVIRWFNATHGILTTINNKNMQIYSGIAHTNKFRRIERIGLLEYWDIKDRASMDETVNWLMDAGHRAEYQGEPKEVAAWDYSRAMSVLSSCYLAGYIEREEALNRSLEIAKIIQSEYISWDAFMESYFKGFALWSQDSDEFRRKVYTTMKQKPNSPYSLPWNLELKKVW